MFRNAKRIEKIGQEKQALFDRGASEKLPELRRMLAQQFEVKTSEQLMISRQLNIRSKEIMTVTRLRLLRENAERAKAHGSKLGMIARRDIIRWASDRDRRDHTEMFQQRLERSCLWRRSDEGAPG